MRYKFVFIFCFITLLSIQSAPAQKPQGSAYVTSRYINEKALFDMTDKARIYTPGGMNLFSTGHYGRAFITGTVTLGEVFDARIAENYRIFENYISERKIPQAQGVARYAQASNLFLQELGFDAVLFRPDEYHPVFTKQNDTWMFVRDCPSQKDQNFYHSTRLSNREVFLFGGVKMRPLITIGNIFYVPINSKAYEPYGKQNFAFAQKPDYTVSDYVHTAVFGEEKRREMGIIPTPLSGRTIKAGAWKNENQSLLMVEKGLIFRNQPNANTWGGWGIYLLPLEKDFWQSPEK